MDIVPAVDGRAAGFDNNLFMFTLTFMDDPSGYPSSDSGEPYDVSDADPDERYPRGPWPCACACRLELPELEPGGR